MAAAAVHYCLEGVSRRPSLRAVSFNSLSVARIEHISVNPKGPRVYSKISIGKACLRTGYIDGEGVPLQDFVLLL